MPVTEQLATLLLWLKDRNVRVPATRIAASPDTEADTRAASVVFAGDGTETTPFLAEEADLLVKIAGALGFGPDQVVLTSVNALKAAQADASGPDHLGRLVRGSFIIALGRVAAAALSGGRSAFQELRGTVDRTAFEGLYPVTYTFHPRDLLRFPANKRHAWTDLQAVMRWRSPPAEAAI